MQGIVLNTGERIHGLPGKHLDTGWQGESYADSPPCMA